MNKTVHILLAGGLAALVGSASAQLAPSSQQQRQPAQTPQQQRQLQQAPQQRSEPAPPRPTDPQEFQSRLQALHGDLEEISIRLSEIHLEALLEADVRKLLVDFERDLAEKIRETAPNLGEQVDAHEEVLEKISRMGNEGEKVGSADKDELEELLTQHGELKQQLAPVENQLLNDPEVREARAEYQKELIAAMHEVDPKVEEIIAERMELAQNFMALQQQYLQSQQQQQGSQQQQPGQAPQPGQGAN